MGEMDGQVEEWTAVIVYRVMSCIARSTSRDDEVGC